VPNANVIKQMIEKAIAAEEKRQAKVKEEMLKNSSNTVINDTGAT